MFGVLAGRAAIGVPSDLSEGVMIAPLMLMAGDLGCDRCRVRVEYASANRRLTARAYGTMAAGGRRSGRSLRDAMQQIGASVRMRLITVTSHTWDGIGEPGMPQVGRPCAMRSSPRPVSAPAACRFRIWI
jgi:hypothetical protein